MKKATKWITILIFLFLYLPMLVLVVASFNTGKSMVRFDGFTFDRYRELFQDEALLQLLGNSLIISVVSSFAATVFGTLAAVGICKLRPKMRKAVMSLTNIPMTNPDIVTGVSLSLLFVFVGVTLLGKRNALSFWTLLLAHLTFNLPYVILNVMPKLRQMDTSLTDAAMDLGCTPWQAFYKVTLPQISPGIVAGAIMAFTMSLDDFVISYFVTGSDFIPLPVEIYSYVKKPLQPKLYAMFTLLFLLILVLMIAMNVIEARGEKKKTKQVKPISKTWKMVRSICAAVLVLAMLGGSCYGIVNMIIRNRNTITLNVYNWGQYMARGDDGSRNLIKEFEAKYPHIRVNYVTYDSNEVMYSKLAGGGDQIDVIIPSDYMIARLVEEDMLEELNFDNIPNYKYIDEQFKNQPFDPENKYSVPYTWGTVGIIYNKNVVDEEDLTGWELLWNEKYKNDILMFDNSRDAFAIVQAMYGYDVNTTDPEILQICADKLSEQQPLVQQYVMDQIYDAMIGGEASIAPYYAGDAVSMIDENPDLGFYLPAHQGFNLFIDSMCIPKGSQQKEAAETFINFFCDPEISAANMEWVCYASPISEAKALLDEETRNNPIIYPDEETLKNGVSFIFLSPETSRMVEAMFMKVRNS